MCWFIPFQQRRPVQHGPSAYARLIKRAVAEDRYATWKQQRTKQSVSAAPRWTEDMSAEEYLKHRDAHRRWRSYSAGGGW